MGKQHKITISFGKEYDDVYALLKSKGNASRFVCDLVREQLNGSLDSRIENVVARMMGSRVETKDDDLKRAADGFEF